MGGIARAIAAVLKSALASLGKVAMRWCAKTKSWITERVVEPGVEYFHEAVAGASAAVTGLVPDVIKGAAKLPGQTIRATGAVIEGTGKLAGASLAAVASVPQALASGLAGGRGAMPSPAPQGGQQADAAAEIADVVEAIEARRGASETMRSMRRHSPISYEASLVHRYAAADTYERSDIDLDELPPHLSDWLETLTERQLQHLAQSPSICEEAVAGRRTGLAGMPLPARPTPGHDLDSREAAMLGTVGQIIGDPSAFASRVAAAKGVRRDRQPH